MKHNIVTFLLPKQKKDPKIVVGLNLIKLRRDM
jgi:hypothetical protein